MKQIEILGVKINNVTFDEAISLIDGFVLSKKPHQITTVNPEFIMAAQNDGEFKNIINKSDLSVPDGAGLLFASRYILGTPIKERVTGVDLVCSLAKIANKNKYRVFFLGGQTGVAEKTAKTLKNENPDLVIAGTYAGNPSLNYGGIASYRELRMTDIKPKAKDANLEIVKKIKQAKPDILFVAYGAPKQDKFIFRYKKTLNVPVMIGVGGAFDFISGSAQRAPKWMQKLWLEWLWRLFREPWRFNRIVTASIRFPLAVLFNKKK